MASDTRKALKRAIWNRLLAFVDGAGRSLSQFIGSGADARLYAGLAPENVNYPYIVFTVSDSETDPEYGGNIKEDFDILVNIFNRARDKEADSEIMGDLVEGALLTWRESSPADGLTWGRISSRINPPPDADPSDRDLPEVTVLVRCSSFPTRLTSLNT